MGRDAFARGDEREAGRTEAADIDRATGGAADAVGLGAAATRAAGTGGGQIAPLSSICRTGATGGAGGTGRGGETVADGDGKGGGRVDGGGGFGKAAAGLGIGRTETGAGVKSALCSVIRNR